MLYFQEAVYTSCIEIKLKFPFVIVLKPFKEINILNLN